MKIRFICMALALSLASAGSAAAVKAKKKAKAAKKAVVYVDYSRPGASGGAYGDDTKGCGGTFEVKGGKGVLSANECKDGWGGGLTMNKMPEAAFNATGATTLTLKVKVPKGIKFNLNINENGCGPKEQASFTGEGGADGEQFNSPEMTGTGKMKEYTVKLADFTVAGGYGNPNGNKQVDLGGVASIQLYVIPGQAASTIEVAKVSLK